MSDGEVMAQSGKINEGDEDIDARRTLDSSQSGEIEEEGHRDAVATGGGKESGYSDRMGMAGTEADVRRTSSAEQSELSSRQAELARRIDQVYTQARFGGVEIPARFNMARENAHRAAEAGKAGQIRQMREFQDRALMDLAVARTSLDAPFSGDSMDAAVRTGSPDSAVASTPDEAPAEYRDMVRDYFEALGRM